MAEEKKTNAAPAKAVTAVKKDDTKPGFFKRVAKWFREMRSELKKVVWPTRKQVVRNTIVVILVVLVIGVLIWIFDWIAAAVVKALVNLAQG